MSTAAIDTARTTERLSAFQSEIHTNEPVDNTFVELPVFGRLMKNRKKKAFGRQIMASLDTAQNPSVKSFADTDTFSTTVPDTARTAVFAAKNYGGALVYTWEELRETAGSDHKMFDLVAHRRKNLLNSLKDLMNYDLLKASPGSKDINSIPLIVSTSRSLGGISSSTNSYWDAKETTSVGSFASNGLANMRTMHNDIMATKAGKPKFIVTTQTIMESLEAELDVDVRYSRTDKLERGADSLFFKGSEVLFDDDTISGHMYFLNPEWLEFIVDDAADFSFGPVLESQNAMTFVSKVVWRGQLISVQPRGLGRLTGIS